MSNIEKICQEIERRKKAFDKIYVDIIDDEVLLMSPSVSDNGGVEYIRKEALLEWANKKIDEADIAIDDPAIWGQRNAFKQMIDKLNTL